MPSPDSHERPETQSSDLTGLCVLVVDDSWHVGSGLKSLLESLGADVIGPAATTAEAEGMVSERRPDVALVDINLRHGERSYGKHPVSTAVTPAAGVLLRAYATNA